MAQNITVGGVERKIKTTTRVKGAPRSKRQGANSRGSRTRYWQEGRLRTRKIRNLVRYSGMTLAKATALWDSTRKTRMKGAVGTK